MTTKGQELTDEIRTDRFFSKCSKCNNIIEVTKTYRNGFRKGRKDGRKRPIKKIKYKKPNWLEENILAENSLKKFNDFATRKGGGSDLPSPPPNKYKLKTKEKR